MTVMIPNSDVSESQIMKASQIGGAHTDTHYFLTSFDSEDHIAANRGVHHHMVLVAPLARSCGML